MRGSHSYYMYAEGDSGVFTQLLKLVSLIHYTLVPAFVQSISGIVSYLTLHFGICI